MPTPQQSLAYETGNGPAVSPCGYAGISDNETNVAPLPGCTDPAATNYNPLATQNNGTCIYAPGPCDPLRVGFVWNQYGLGLAATSVSQFDPADPIISYEWDLGTEDRFNGDGEPDPLGFFYDTTGTFTVTLTIQTQSGKTRSVATNVTIVSPYDNSTAPLHLVYATVPVTGSVFCEPPPVL